MLILPHSCFIHVPKTGGTWVKQALQATGIPCEDYRVNGNPHLGWDCCPVPGIFRFAFVRHPLNFYRSYWQFKMSVGWDESNPMDVSCRSDEFHTFLRSVMDTYPGYCGKLMNAFVGEGDTEIEFIGRYETLLPDLLTALELAGEEVDAVALRNTPPVNVSDKINHPAVYIPELKREICEAEKEMMERFGYEEDIDA